MVVGEPNINNIMSGLENTGGVKKHNHKKKLKQRFDIIKKLGQGTFGKVQLGINKETGQEVAIKTIKKSKIESEADLIRIRREIQIMSSVQHPNIIHIYEVFENREKMVLVMEYAAGGELYDYLSERKVLQEDEARRIFRQIATACYYCHKHKICHRDLKLENILLDENNNAKIADFGLSNVFDDQRLLNTFCGSPLYASPEIVKGTPYQGPEVDCWSLGVLLYTLVYGAMPFDGSNFKRLVKQISQGDYFEPTKPSPASPLIRDMLTVNPKTRASIEKICTHWWVNEGYDENCLDISEELANQTPVRLDLLLSLAPPPPQLESDKLVVTGDAAEEAAKTEASACARSQSVGSLMELGHPAERRIKDLINEDKIAQKRKLETTVSTDRVNLDREGLKRKEKIVKENTVADITVHGAIREDVSLEDASMSEAVPLNKSSTQTLSREMDVEPFEEPVDPSLQGAVCAEIIEEAKKSEKKQPIKVKKTLSVVGNKMLEGINEIPSQENVANNVDKENIEQVAQETKPQEVQEQKTGTKTAVKKKPVKKKVLTDKNDNEKTKAASPQPEMKSEEKTQAEEHTPKEEDMKPEDVPSKPIERRRSRIFEAAEKFQNLMSPTETKPAVIEKPKKIVIPGVSVDGFKKEFERKASLTSTSPPKLKGTVSKKHIIEAQSSIEQQDQPEVMKPELPLQKQAVSNNVEKPVNNKTDELNDERRERVKNAVSIISSALDMDGTRKSKSRPCMMRKPPVPFGSSGRSASGNITMISTPLTPPVGPKPFVKPVFDNEVKRVTPPSVEPVEESQTSSAEITLKSATLPRRKTTKAEIQLNYPVPKPATMEFKTEVSHPVEAPPTKLSTQRSEVIVPVSAQPSIGFRASSLEPEQLSKPRERIIPISFEKANIEAKENMQSRESVQSPPPKPPMPRPFQTQRSLSSQRSNSLSRQSTQDSDTETVTSTGEPIRKSPREYIIPIAVEGGGYVTPRAGSLEPSETSSTTSTMTGLSRSKFGRPRRLNSRLSDRDSEDESPFASLHRHSSFGKDSDTEDSKRDTFHMHRLRSSRPKKSTLEHNDSLSSGEEDDDDGFEILTAENLFSTLLSRVRDLTQRLNVEDGGRPGFPSSRLLSHFDHGTNFWNLHNRMEPLSRHSPLGRSFNRERSTDNTTSGNFSAPWRRSVSRDLATDIESVFKDPNSLPRGDKQQEENLNLADLDLKKLKLSDEDALALSYLTPGLSKRIQKQLLAQLAPSEARKLHRTLSSRNSSDNPYNSPEESKFMRKSADRLSSTLPRRFSSDKGNLYQGYSERRSISEQENAIPEDEQVTENKGYKSFLPVTSQTRLKRRERRPYSDFSVRSASIEYEPSYRKPRVTHSVSLREPRVTTRLNETRSDVQSPDSSVSESLSQNDSYVKDTDSLSDLSSKMYSFDNYSSLARPSSYSRYSDNSNASRYLTPSKSYEIPHSSTPNSPDTNKTELQKPSSSSRRISRFLRPDFFDPPKGENVFLKEKKEREMETQKVLKEIRDKRKSRLNIRRERSKSREKSMEPKFETASEIKASNNIEQTHLANNRMPKSFLEKKEDIVKETNALLDNVSNNIKNLESNVNNMVHDYVNVPGGGKKVQENTKVMPDYVNVPKPTANSNNINTNSNTNNQPVLKKEKVSKIARPKSYPAENLEQIEKKLPEKAKQEKITPEKIIPEKVTSGKQVVDKVSPERSVVNKVPLEKPVLEKLIPEKQPTNKVAPEKATQEKVVKISPEKESKISRLRKGFVRQGSKEREKAKEEKNDSNKNTNEEEKGHKNKLLQTIEKKLEKFRAANSASKDPEEVKALKEKKSGVEGAIRKLREQSLPRNIEPCTESGLIKRAVSVEDLSNFSGNKPLQASRKSVTKILGLFKKYEEQRDDKKNDKVVKKKKVKECGNGEESKSKLKKASDKKSKESVIVNNSNNNNNNADNSVNVKEQKQNTDNFDKRSLHNDCPSSQVNARKVSTDKPERPRSLLFDKMKHFQQYNGAKSDTVVNDKESKVKVSKLPVNAFRRSLNLDSISHEPPKFYKQPNKNSASVPQLSDKSSIENNSLVGSGHSLVDPRNKPDRQNLKLDLTKAPVRNRIDPRVIVEPTPSTSGENTKEFIPPENRNSLTTTDDSSVFLSPCDDNISDSWSVCSDYHTRDLYSPVSPNGHLYSGDEGESVIDRIRRKSFYTRFNENKRPRRPSLTRNYNDLYKDVGYKSPTTDYGSLDRRSYDYHKPVSRRSSFASSLQEPRDYNKTYTRSSSVLNDYINVPNRYQTYSSKIGRPASNLYSDSEDNTLDDYLSTAKSRKYSTHLQPSRQNRKSVSPVNEQYLVDHASSSVTSNLTSPTSSETV